MPPKPEPKVCVPLSETYYAALMAADAQKVRNRYRRTFGGDNASKANERQRLAAKDRRNDLAKVIFAILTEHGPMTAAQVKEHLTLSREQTRVVLRLMKIDGLVDYTKGGDCKAYWRAI
jgi:hypothetical protein